MKFKTYTSIQYGFSVDYPSKWAVKEHAAMFLASFVEDPTNEQSCSINITIQNLDVKMTQQQLLEVSIQQIQSINAQDIETGSCTIGKYKGDFLQYYAPEQRIKNKQCFFIKDSSVYIVSYTSSFKNFKSRIHYLDQCCESFKQFTPKGYKYAQFEAFTSTVKNVNNETVYYQYWTPKAWKTSKKEKEGNKQVQEYKDQANDLQLKVEFESLTQKGDETTTDKKHQNNRTHLIYTNSKHNCLFTIDFSFPKEDEETSSSWEPIFKRIVADSKIETSHLVSPIYDRFYNFIFRYYVNLPKSFELDNRSSNTTSMIFIDKEYPHYPVFNITMEDLGVAIPLEKYKEILLSFYTTSVQGARIINEENSRLDKYRALRINMDGRDPEIDKKCKVIIQCAVVKRTKGLLLNVRLPSEIFEEKIKKYFYMFYSLVFYKN
ncbi:hypothetical protein DICPUDRAFT_33983 [Dictyostelium purpureum]|uniref:Uncharacterized protein n=1 Tax=Dictyostelium purpureum TaxID=5786 RepID=F0ZLU6_DICPU|nr:uncharacterized protein DICPUDRAFT_33983 [Dictyostelium purpureum]EGC35075.1 hypothetical protein DICPUDRAFT_33983 [Dictyostelium purpureum]|eukprot:XP_003288382.1 hypothetical protein DICPUDRAFT_33983 [Dictyostelium purpureum]